jgi:hypothetical protein
MNIDLTKLDESQPVELNRQIVARLRYPKWVAHGSACCATAGDGRRDPEHAGNCPT